MDRRAVLSIALLAMLALALPATSSASWTHKGKGELKENASVTLSGELTVTTSVGKVTCPTSISGTLTASGSAGDVTSYTVSEPSKCDLSESLGAVCGTHGVSKVEKTGTWALTAKETTIEVSSIDLHFYFGKCLIPSFRLKGTATATPDKTTAMSTLTLSGSQTLYNSLEEEVGTASLGGSPTVSPAGTYGVKTAPLVKTAWLMGNEHLSENEEMTLSGEFSFSYSGGSVSCTASAVLALTSGEVEEEEPEGEVKSFTVSEPSKCLTGGALKTLCGEKPVKSIEKTGAWALNATAADISIVNLVLDYKFEKCAVTSLLLEGSATFSVKEPIAITAATFSGKPAIYNASEEKIDTAELTGTPSASPSGTYAIKKVVPPSVKMGGVSDPNSVITATGILGFNTLGSWFQCTSHGELQGEGSATTGRVTTFQITTNTCEGEGLFEGCTLTEHDFTKEDGTTTSGATKDKPNWTYHVVGNAPSISVLITNVKIHNVFSGCEVSEVALDFSETGINLTPTTQTNFTSGTIHGEGTAELETSESTLPNEAYSGNETTGRGTIPLTGASSGTYSLG